jgi:hypothetical protein
VEAQAEFQRAQGEYVARQVRDSAVVDAVRAGVSTHEIKDLVPDLTRAVTRRNRVPGVLLSPTDALRLSGLTARQFLDAVRAGRISPVQLPGDVRAFRPEDVVLLRPSA